MAKLRGVGPGPELECPTGPVNLQVELRLYIVMDFLVNLDSKTHCIGYDNLPRVIYSYGRGTGKTPLEFQILGNPSGSNLIGVSG